MQRYVKSLIYQLPLAVLNYSKQSLCRVTYNQPYAELDVRQCLDIYQPHFVSADLPVLIYVHGGSWNSGDKADYRFIANRFVALGYVVVIVNYRLAPAYTYPSFIYDIQHALQWVGTSIQHYGGNAKQVFVMGHSAGAFNVISALTDARCYCADLLASVAVLGVIGLAGPYHFDFIEDPSYSYIFPTDALPAEVMPSYAIRRGAPPHLLCTASSDRLVPLHHVKHLLHALQQQQVPCEWYEVKHTTHMTIVASLAPLFRNYFSLAQACHLFMQRQLDCRPV